MVKSSLLDWPGKLAAVVFTVGCNFRCPFCHNRDLVTGELFKKSGSSLISEKEIMEFLERKKRILDGVVITGGEPTIQTGLAELCQKIKEMELLIKLDTNGSNPEVLEGLIRSKYVDYFAIDIKTRWDKYDVVGAGLVPARSRRVATLQRRAGRVARTVQILGRSGIDFELRTTVVPGIHSLEILKMMGEEIFQLSIINYQLSKKVPWFWQDFRAENCLDERYLKKKGFGKEKLDEWRREIQKGLKKVTIAIR